MESLYKFYGKRVEAQEDSDSDVTTGSFESQNGSESETESDINCYDSDSVTSEEGSLTHYEGGYPIPDGTEWMDMFSYCDKERVAVIDVGSDVESEYEDAVEDETDEFLNNTPHSHIYNFR